MTTFGRVLLVIVNLYLLGGVVVVAGVFTLVSIRVPIPMSMAGFFRWTGWVALAALVGLLAGSLL